MTFNPYQKLSEDFTSIQTSIEVMSNNISILPRVELNRKISTLDEKLSETTNKYFELKAHQSVLGNIPKQYTKITQEYDNLIELVQRKLTGGSSPVEPSTSPFESPHPSYPSLEDEFAAEQLQTTLLELPPEIKKNAMFARNEAVAKTLLTNLKKPGSFVIWPSSGGEGKISFIQKGLYGDLLPQVDTDLYFLSLPDILQIHEQSYLREKGNYAEDRDSAHESLKNGKEGHFVIWPSGKKDDSCSENGKKGRFAFLHRGKKDASSSKNDISFRIWQKNGTEPNESDKRRSTPSASLLSSIAEHVSLPQEILRDTQPSQRELPVLKHSPDEPATLPRPRVPRQPLFGLQQPMHQSHAAQIAISEQLSTLSTEMRKLAKEASDEQEARDILSRAKTPGSFVIWPHSSDSNKATFIQKGFKGDKLEKRDIDLNSKNLELMLFDAQISYLLEKKHFTLNKGSAEEMLKNQGRDHFVVWPSSRNDGSFGFWQNSGSNPSEDDIIRIQPSTPLLKAIAEYDLFGELECQPNNLYDKQLVLNLGSGRSARGIEVKSAKRRLSNQMIDLRAFEEKNISPLEKASLDQITFHSRIYIIGHCSAGSDTITSDEGIEWRVNEFADFLKENCLNLQHPDRPVIISLIACQSAQAGLGGEPSFAEKLSQELAKNGIPAIVKGRMDNVSRANEQTVEHFHKFVAEEGNGYAHHRPGSKFEFSTPLDPGGPTKITETKYNPLGRRYIL